MKIQIHKWSIVKQLALFLGICLMIFSCETEKEFSSVKPINWEKRTVQFNKNDTLISGQTYLSVYSQIYSSTEHRTHNLTVTVSMKNINLNDSVFIEKATYFNTKGDLIRTYFSKPIYLAPLETVEIVIDEVDKQGGTGANFVFDWKKKSIVNDPHFESVMISTSGQQGISFTSQGIKIE
ncbi:DUF3124 domain-containing protein [Lutibacter sp.]|uniref:DUF3124 domain-containing protein n=1 Tax=Lutibacter sp. TaxID=1925666 RepID=UPI0034A034A6